jgi:hypothetical protein
MFSVPNVSAFMTDGILMNAPVLFPSAGVPQVHAIGATVKQTYVSDAISTYSFAPAGMHPIQHPAIKTRKIHEMAIASCTVEITMMFFKLSKPQ